MLREMKTSPVGDSNVGNAQDGSQDDNDDGGNNNEESGTRESTSGSGGDQNDNDDDGRNNKRPNTKILTTVTPSCRRMAPPTIRLTKTRKTIAFSFISI
jgi:hypothetical protein